MKVDELIKQRADELHDLHAHDWGRLDDLEDRTRPRSRSQVWVLIGVAAAVLLIFGPVAIFLRSADPMSNLIPDGGTVTAVTGPAVPSGEITTGEALFEAPGDAGLGPVMSSGSDLVVSGFDIVLRSTDGGGTWEVTGAGPPGDDALILTEVAGGNLLSIGAHDGASSRLYRSGDHGATWEQVELPVPPEIVQVVPGLIAHRGDEWVISGVGTQSSFDADASLYVWRSSDTIDWEVEEVADLQGRFAYSEVAEVVDGRLVIVTRVASDTAPQLLAFEETSTEWLRTELTPIMEAQAGLTSEPVNTQAKGAGIVADRLQVWWRFTDGLGEHRLSAVAYRAGPGEWGAELLSGVAPETVSITPDGLIGTAHPGTEAPMLTPGFTAIVASNDGVSWSEIGRVDGLYLRQLAQLDDRSLIAAGNETALNNEGFVTISSSGIWEVALSDDLGSILDSR